jgi:hypothetical protein
MSEDEEYEKLTERISIRFTLTEVADFKHLARQENERKVSALLRRICVTHLRKKLRKGH